MVIETAADHLFEGNEGLLLRLRGLAKGSVLGSEKPSHDQKYRQSCTAHASRHRPHLPPLVIGYKSIPGFHSSPQKKQSPPLRRERAGLRATIDDSGVAALRGFMIDGFAHLGELEV